jgi:hypothetical protein
LTWWRTFSISTVTFGVEGLHLRRQASQFGEHPDHDVVFFHAFQHVVLGLGTASRAVG